MDPDLPIYLEDPFPSGSQRASKRSSRICRYSGGHAPEPTEKTKPEKLKALAETAPTVRDDNSDAQTDSSRPSLASLATSLGTSRSRKSKSTVSSVASRTWFRWRSFSNSSRSRTNSDLSILPEDPTYPQLIRISVGDYCETTSRVTVRVGEALESESLVELPSGVMVRIVEMGENLRRAKIETESVSGWISVRTKDNFPLVTKLGEGLLDFEVGSRYRTLSLIILREGEALDAEIIDELRPGTVLTIIGRGANARRVQVLTAEHGAGWISLATRQGQLLVGEIPKAGESRESRRSSIFGDKKDKVKVFLESAGRGDLQSLKKASRSGVFGRFDVNCTDVRGKSALIYASAFNHLAVVEYLLSLEVNVNATDDTLKTALHHASKKSARTGNSAGIALSSLTPPSSDEQSALVQALLDGKASVEARDHHGCTPLMLGCAYGLESVVLMLIKGGACVQAEDAEGSRPLDYAIKFEHQGVAQLLRNAGAKDSSSDEDVAENDVDDETRHSTWLFHKPHPCPQQPYTGRSENSLSTSSQQPSAVRTESGWSTSSGQPCASRAESGLSRWSQQPSAVKAESGLSTSSGQPFLSRAESGLSTSSGQPRLSRAESGLSTVLSQDSMVCEQIGGCEVASGQLEKPQQASGLKENVGGPLQSKSTVDYKVKTRSRASTSQKVRSRSSVAQNPMLRDAVLPQAPLPQESENSTIPKAVLPPAPPSQEVESALAQNKVRPSRRVSQSNGRIVVKGKARAKTKARGKLKSGGIGIIAVVAEQEFPDNAGEVEVLEASDTVEAKEQVKKRLVAVVASSQVPSEIEGAIKVARSAGVDAQELEQAEERVKFLTHRAMVLDELRHSDAARLPQAISEAVACGIQEDEIEKGRKRQSVESQKQKARDMLEEAEGSGDVAKLQIAIGWAQRLKLPSTEIGFYEKALQQAEKREAACDALHAAMESEDLCKLKQAILAAKELGVAADEIEAAESSLQYQEEHKINTARETLSKAVSSVPADREAMELAMKQASEACLEHHEYAECQELLRIELLKEKAMGEVWKALAATTEVDMSSGVSITSARDQLSNALQTAREAGVGESLLKEGELRRRRLHNAAEELKGSVRVSTRIGSVKPPKKRVASASAKHRKPQA